jgi:transcriptional repressor NrdR
MHCPYCRNTDTRVLDSRVTDDGGAIRRRRSCPADNGGCGKRFSTVEQMQLVVVKRSGATEPFARDKAIAGVRKACKGRPVSEDDLACLGQQVEDTLRSEGWAEVPAHEVGLAILAPLRELDEVAYLRFASVYRAFESADDFEAEIAVLRAERAAAVTTADAEVDEGEARADAVVEEREGRARLETTRLDVQPAPTG